MGRRGKKSSGALWLFPWDLKSRAVRAYDITIRTPCRKNLHDSNDSFCKCDQKWIDHYSLFSTLIPKKKKKRRGHFPLYSYSQSANNWPSHAYTLIPKKKHILSKMIRFLICHDILFHTHTATLTFHTNPPPPPLAANDKSRTLLSISCYYHYCYITTHLVFFLVQKEMKILRQIL